MDEFLKTRLSPLQQFNCFLKTLSRRGYLCICILGISQWWIIAVISKQKLWYNRLVSPYFQVLDVYKNKSFMNIYYESQVQQASVSNPVMAPALWKLILSSVFEGKLLNIYRIHMASLPHCIDNFLFRTCHNNLVMHNGKIVDKDCHAELFTCSVYIMYIYIYYRERGTYARHDINSLPLKTHIRTQPVPREKK